MNSYVYQQKAKVGCAGVVGEMVRGDFSVSDGVVCPKPRRLGLFNNRQTEDRDLKAGSELLDIILTKGNYEVEGSNFQMSYSPPFFNGSPPCRASNPLIQDAQFGNNNFLPILSFREGSATPSPQPSSASGRKNGGGCVPVKFGNKSAPVRIEGFNCSISSVA